MRDFKNGASGPLVQLTPQAGDPASLADGQIWYNSALGRYRCMKAGVVQDLAGGAAATWTNITLVVPDGRGQIDITQNVVDSNCLATSNVVLGFGNTTSADENEPEMLSVLSMAASPNAGSFDITATFSEPHSGPIKLRYQIN